MHALRGIESLELATAAAAVAGIDLVAATDVDVPLLGPRGATYGFAPQKGAIDPQLIELESTLQRFAIACGRRDDGRDAAVALGAGAAGGIGFALIRLGAHRLPGIDTVWDESDIDLDGIDLNALDEHVNHPDNVRKTVAGFKNANDVSDMDFWKTPCEIAIPAAPL